MTQSKVKTDDIRDRWENLGIAFAINSSKASDADPEATLVESLKEFQNDRKLLALILAWLKEFGDLVHVERVKAMIPNLSANELAWLGGLAQHQVTHSASNRNSRWQSIVATAQKHLGKPAPLFETSKLDNLQSERNGEDESFALFGLRIPKVLPADSRKIRSRDIIKKNLWLRMRLLFGTNWRADVATTILLELAKTSYQAGKVLGCSSETAYRNWNALKEVEIERLLKAFV